MTTFKDIIAKSSYHYRYSDSIIKDVTEALILDYTNDDITKFITFITKGKYSSILSRNKQNTSDALGLITAKKMLTSKDVTKILNVCSGCTDNYFEWLDTMTEKGFVLTPAQNTLLMKSNYSKTLILLMKNNTITRQEFDSIFLQELYVSQLILDEADDHNIIENILLLMKKNKFAITNDNFKNACGALRSINYEKIFSCFSKLKYKLTKDDYIHIAKTIYYENLHRFIAKYSDNSITQFTIDDCISIMGYSSDNALEILENFRFDDKRMTEKQVDQMSVMLYNFNEKFPVLQNLFTIEITQNFFNNAFKIKGDAIFKIVTEKKIKGVTLNALCLKYATSAQDPNKVKYLLQNKIKPTAKNIDDLCESIMSSGMYPVQNCVDIVNMFVTFGLIMTISIYAKLMLARMPMDEFDKYITDKNAVDRMKKFYGVHAIDYPVGKSKKAAARKLNHIESLEEMFKSNNVKNIILYMKEHNVKPNMVCFENSVIGDFSILDYVVDTYGYKPSILAIMRVLDLSKRCVLLAKFYPEHSVLDAVANDAPNDDPNKSSSSSDSESDSESETEVKVETVPKKVSKMIKSTKKQTIIKVESDSDNESEKIITKKPIPKKKSVKKN